VPVVATATQRLETLAAAEPASLDDVLAFYDELAPVAVEDMLGEWDGGVVPTGHPGEAQLDGLRWAGKAFRGADDVDPIVVLDDGGARVASDVMGSATLRRVEYRGVVTATMVYDRHAIFDHFRRVSPDVVLGVMDRKGEQRPLVFFLSRRSAPA
jgi:Domain of unknown function (DUF4334)/GXWXG protein